MPTLIATPGATANSYATLAQAQAYMDTLVPVSITDAWNEAGEDDQGNGLIMATRLLDQWFYWYGAITDLHQSLLWPRSGVLRPGIAEGQPSSGAVNPWHTPFGVELDRNTVPLQIVNATAELARQLLAEDRTADSSVETQGIESLRAGSVALTFKGNVTAKPIPDAVLAMVNDLGTLKSRSGTGAVTMRRA